MNIRSITLLTIIMISLGSCLQFPNQYSELPPGPWRGILKLSDLPTAEQAAILGEDEKILDYFELPFNMLVE